MKSEQISNFLQARIDEKDFPSAVYLVGEKDEVLFEDALGLAVVEPKIIKAELDTIYDLASLTKPLITGLLCAQLLERGEIKLGEKISRYFSEFEPSEKDEITIHNLLTHTSGFISWMPFYADFNYLQAVTSESIRIIFQKDLLNPIGTKVVYSDLNFILLGHLLETIYDTDLYTIAEQEIFTPLKLTNTFFNPRRQLLNNIAASEKGNEFEKQTCLELGYQIDFPYSLTPFRNYQIWGEVHDGNAYFMSGVSGHAGLFSNSFETFKIARQFLAEETMLLKPETCQLFRTNFTVGLNEARSIGFQLAETKDSTASLALSRDSFGHLGFTGTSLWIEPETERVFILLTNRTHARELPFVNTNPTRRRFHELAVEQLT